ncbi:MAG: hypothetical protein R2704_06325 [Microthrixaceae bacterium]
MIVDLKLQPVLHDQQLMVAALQPDRVGLKAVPQPGLGDSPTLLELGDQVQLLVEQVGVDAIGKVGDHARQQQPAGAPGTGGEGRLLSPRPPGGLGHRGGR